MIAREEMRDDVTLWLELLLLFRVEWSGLVLNDDGDDGDIVEVAVAVMRLLL